MAYPLRNTTTYTTPSITGENLALEDGGLLLLEDGFNLLLEASNIAPDFL
jgi:hypothetical protein